MENTTTTSSEMARVAARLPPFWPERPDVWFFQADSQFAITGITSETTNLSNKYTQRRWMTLSLHLHKTNPTLPLLTRLSPSIEERHHRLLRHEDMGDRTPSQFLRHLRRLAPYVSDSNNIIHTNMQIFKHVSSEVSDRTRACCLFRPS
jgi:hypothetical protein